MGSLLQNTVCTQIVKSRKIGREIKKGVDGISGPNHLANLRTKVFPALTLHPKTLGSEGYWSHIWKFLHFHRIFPISKSCQIIPERWGSKFMISISNQIKPNYFKKQRFSSSFLLTWSKYTGSKWPWSTPKASSMHFRHGTKGQ